MLRRVIEDLVRAGISDIRVNSHHLPETVDAVLADCHNLDANLTSQFRQNSSVPAGRFWLRRIGLERVPS